MQRVDDGLSQGNVPQKRWVHRVLKEVVIQQSVLSNRVKKGLAIDKLASVASSDLAISVLEGGDATKRKAIKVPRRNEVVVGPGYRRSRRVKNAAASAIINAL